jgi:hypothetical protein
MSGSLLIHNGVSTLSFHLTPEAETAPFCHIFFLIKSVDNIQRKSSHECPISMMNYRAFQTSLCQPTWQAMRAVGGQRPSRLSLSPTPLQVVYTGWLPAAERRQATYPPLPGKKMIETLCTRYMCHMQEVPWNWGRNDNNDRCIWHYYHHLHVEQNGRLKYQQLVIYAHIICFVSLDA